MLSGLNIPTFESVKKLTNKKITIGGGVKDLADVQMGQENNFDHMVIGKAIYENKFSLDDLIKFNA
jgi:phosphoribosylformimino-5-aminoimidazole carboxamide ribotide isomerase